MTRRTPTGLPRSARTSSDREGCPLYPGDDGAHPGLRIVPSRRPPLLNATSHSLGSNIPSAEGPLDEASTRVQAIHPSGLPLARCRPDGTGDSFGFPPSFAPRRPRAGRRTSGWGQAIEHGPGQRSRHQPNLQSSVLTQCVRPRVAPIQATLSAGCAFRGGCRAKSFRPARLMEFWDAPELHRM